VLTYAEARERSRLIDVLGYHVDLDVSGGEDAFGSASVVRFGCREPGAGSFIELRPARLDRVMLNGQELDPGILRGNRLPLAGLQAVNELRVEAEMPYSRAGAGLHRFTDPADGQVYLALHAGLDNAQRVFAAFDQPDLKAPFSATIVAPGPWAVIGNGAARPAETAASGLPGARRWQLATTPPISTYLCTLLAGPYHSIRAEHRGLAFGLHARQSLAGSLHRDAEEILAITRACFDRYLEIFTEPYPFDSYDQAFVPELAVGAVENPGCVTFRDEFLFPAAATRAERQLRGIVIAHEMAHMWFGGLVTMRWWNDVWLSESFAEYMGFQVLSEATAFTAAWADCALARKPRGYDADQRASTHPVAPGPQDVPDNDAALASYDDISYAKGAAALRQLVARTGWPAFMAGINDYLARYRFGSATLADLMACLGRASGADLDGWADRWLRTTGVDTLTVRRDGAAGSTGSVAHHGRRPHRLWIGVYDRPPGDAGQLVLRASLPVSIGADQAEVELPDGTADPPPALLLPNDGDFSFCKIRLDPQSWAALSSWLGQLPDPLSRAVAWNAARDLVRDGELPARSYLDLAARHLPAETDISVTGQVLGYARWVIADRYLPRSARAAALADLAGLCRIMLGRPAANEDADGIRLVAGLGLIDSAARPDDIAELRSWLEAGRWPGGPDLDSRLRWQIVLRLVVLGAIGEPGIEQEAGRDTTAAGPQSAARCRAALPDPQAKQAAWAAMFGQAQAGGPSSALRAATAEGFWQADQADTLAGYALRYFPALADLAGQGDAATARVLVRHGFPHHAADAATLRAGQECLADGGITGSLRRLLADQLEDLGRAVRVSSGP
jgi:aminopeptidase N